MEFEEKEFEHFLYQELITSPNGLWPPGQVLEHQLGFDAAIFTVHDVLWRLKGLSAPRPGIVLQKYVQLWPGSIAASRVPTWKFNCFIQAKRPTFGSRLPRDLTSLGNVKPWFKFEVNPVQQETIGPVAERLKKKALFLYAAPVFTTSQQLFSNAGLGRTVQSSTFPDIIALNGHSAWCYNTPGGVGVVNAAFEEVRGLGLFEHLQRFRDTFPADDAAGESPLLRLAASIREAVPASFSRLATPRGAEILSAWRQIDALADGAGLAALVQAFLVVELFAHFNGLSWLVAPDFG